MESVCSNLTLSLGIPGILLSGFSAEKSSPMKLKLREFALESL